MIVRKDDERRLRDAVAMTAPDALLDMLVSDLLASTPAAARVFLERGMSCVGCAFAPFETVAEVASIYGMAPAELVTELLATLTPEGAPPSSTPEELMS